MFTQFLLLAAVIIYVALCTNCKSLKLGVDSNLGYVWKSQISEIGYRFQDSGHTAPIKAFWSSSHLPRPRYDIIE